MSRKGKCWDHAVVERVCGRLKREGLSEHPPETPATATAATMEYGEMGDHRHRRYSPLGSLSPNAFEAQVKVA